MQNIISVDKGFFYGEIRFTLKRSCRTHFYPKYKKVLEALFVTKHAFQTRGILQGILSSRFRTRDRKSHIVLQILNLEL